MEVITHINQSVRLANVSVALGTFDGVHVGHQKVIGRAVTLAKQQKGISAVFTFANHPLSVIMPSQCPPFITNLADKERLIAKLGIDVLYCVPFNLELLKLPPIDFINLLSNLFTPANIIVGPNFTFGYRGSGTPELLAKFGEKMNFKVEVQDAVYVEGDMVSSTRIRNFIREGNVEQAYKLLGRPYHITGKVVHGDKRGRTIGFPTANIMAPSCLILPRDGVYAVRSIVNGNHHHGLANIGTNPTFNNQERRVETYILDFAADLYGQSIQVDFCKKIRNEIKFPGISELKQQILQDVDEARQFFSGKA